MKPSSPHSPPHFLSPITESYPELGDVLVEIEIRPEDISEMQYHLNECPMANMARDNAVAYALYRVVKPGYEISVTAHEGNVVARIGGKKFPLEKDLSVWLAKAMMGHVPKPTKSVLRLPEVLVRAKVAARRKKLELLQFYGKSSQTKGSDGGAAVGF